MPSLSQVRTLRIRRLATLARELLEGGANVHVLASKLEASARRLWPEVSEKTRRDYVMAALRTTFRDSQPSELDGLEAMDLAQEIAVEAPRRGRIR